MDIPAARYLLHRTKTTMVPRHRRRIGLFFWTGWLSVVLTFNVAWAAQMKVSVDYTSSQFSSIGQFSSSSSSFREAPAPSSKLLSSAQSPSPPLPTTPTLASDSARTSTFISPAKPSKAMQPTTSAKPPKPSPGRFPPGTDNNPVGVATQPSLPVPSSNASVAAETSSTSASATVAISPDGTSLLAVKTPSSYFSYKVELMILPPAADELESMRNVTQTYLDSLFRDVYTGDLYYNFQYSKVTIKHTAFLGTLARPFNFLIDFGITAYFVQPSSQTPRQLPSPSDVAQRIANSVTISGTFLSLAKSASGFRLTTAITFTIASFPPMPGPTTSPTQSPFTSDGFAPTRTPGLSGVDVVEFRMIYQMPFTTKTPTKSQLGYLRNATQGYLIKLFRGIYNGRAYANFAYSEVFIRSTSISNAVGKPCTLLISYRITVFFQPGGGGVVPTSLQIVQDIVAAMRLSSSYLNVVKSVPGLQRVSTVAYANNDLPVTTPVSVLPREPSAPLSTDVAPQRMPSTRPSTRPSGSPRAQAASSRPSFTPSSPSLDLGQVVASTTYFAYQIPLMTRAPSSAQLDDLRKSTQRYLDQVFRGIYTGSFYNKFHHSEAVVRKSSSKGSLGPNFNLFVSYEFRLYFKQRESDELPSPEKVAFDMQSALLLSETYLVAVQATSSFQRTTRVAFSLGDYSFAPSTAPSTSSPTSTPIMIIVGDTDPRKRAPQRYIFP